MKCDLLGSELAMMYRNSTSHSSGKELPQEVRSITRRLEEIKTATNTEASYQ